MSRAAALVARFGAGAAATAEPVQDDIDVRTQANGDAIFFFISPGDFTSNQVAFSPRVNDSSAIFARFQANIPQGATILDARVTLYQNQNASWNSDDDREVGCEQVDDAAQCTSRSNGIGRYESVGSTITWSNSGTINNQQPIPGPDLKDIVQAIVNRSGWESGNHIAFWIYHPGGASTNHQQRLHNTHGESVRPRFECDFEYTP